MGGPLSASPKANKAVITNPLNSAYTGHCGCLSWRSFPKHGFGNRTKDHTGDPRPQSCIQGNWPALLYISRVRGFRIAITHALLDFIDIDEQHLRCEAALSAILDERDLLCRKILHPSFNICYRHDGARYELATSAEPWALGGSFHIKRGSRLPPTYGYR